MKCEWCGQEYTLPPLPYCCLWAAVEGLDDPEGDAARKEASPKIDIVFRKIDQC